LTQLIEGSAISSWIKVNKLGRLDIKRSLFELVFLGFMLLPYSRMGEHCVAPAARLGTNR
jgi:hypothetical protein